MYSALVFFAHGKHFSSLERDYFDSANRSSVSLVVDALNGTSCRSRDPFLVNDGIAVRLLFTNFREGLAGYLLRSSS
jgi:hypothetical protein